MYIYIYIIKVFCASDIYLNFPPPILSHCFLWIKLKLDGNDSKTDW